MAAKLLQMGHVVYWSEPQLAPPEAQWYRMWGEALVTGLLWTFWGSHTLEPRSQGVQYPHLEKGARWRPYTPGAGLGLQLLFLRGSPLPLFSRHASTSPQKRQSQLLTAEAPAPSTTLLSQKWLRTCSQSPASLSSHDLISTLRNLKTPLCPTPVFFLLLLPNSEHWLSCLNCFCSAGCPSLGLWWCPRTYASKRPRVSGGWRPRRELILGVLTELAVSISAFEVGDSNQRDQMGKIKA